MTHNQFIVNVKYFWKKGRGCEAYKETLIEYHKELDTIVNKFTEQYLNGTYTDTINKEVEALWQRRNSKLAKALK